MGPQIGRHEVVAILHVMSARSFFVKRQQGSEQKKKRKGGGGNSPAVATEVGAPMALTSASVHADGWAANATSAFKVLAGSTKRNEYRPPKQYPVTAIVLTFRLVLK